MAHVHLHLDLDLHLPHHLAPSQLSLDAAEGCVSPLGVSEPEESIGKPLFADAPTGYRPGCESHWQTRAEGKKREVSEAELNAALNLL